MRRKFLTTYSKYGTATRRKIKFRAFGPNHEGVIITAAPVKDTIKELEKDYDIVLLKSVKLAENSDEEVQIFCSDTRKRIY